MLTPAPAPASAPESAPAPASVPAPGSAAAPAAPLPPPGYPIVHPLKDVRLGEAFPSFAAGEGIYVQDTNGKTYIDGISGLWNVSLGYRHPGIRQAIVDQLDRLPYVNPVDGANPTTLAFAETLLRLTPPALAKVAYTCTGSESVELAIKLIRKFHQLSGRPERTLIAVLDKSYHGTYYGSMSASGIDQEISESYGPRVPGFRFHPVPLGDDGKPAVLEGELLERRLAELERLFEEEEGRLGGIILEPIIGSGGILPLPDRYLRRVRELCDRSGALLAFDEVATGMGRTGRMFAFEHSGAAPDILCLSKGINSGYLPLGATLFSDAIYQAFARAGSHIEHLSTQNGNPIACAAGLATVEALERPGLLAEVTRKGELLRRLLEEALAANPMFLETRGKGLMIGVALTSDRSARALLDPDRLREVVARLRQRGLLVYPIHTPGVTTGFHLFPPLIIEDGEIRKIVQIVARSLGGR
ncbi:Adenosylmethionine-8-amino-7-oxononanoate aminotransferase [Paenibacillus pasadenensis]|uniref:Adenosylmethionine-8-amino-7-oxononanoate aminotransferase n=1 Tax=Paenibacillus pasadenensis TaxID=217090 RepID=A0A2N5N0E9_9BACL|nr:daptide-type RiPP biosynthesis aminotransferase [Paenibacillus pasadenensis]PLT43817.1 Adenosylmethionine-8-amino-7-oxononanoate aminotransferase [Paenibacillus pasadenensis]